jgi:predicted TIM-barrel fold metal-dependent hydrolase
MLPDGHYLDKDAHEVFGERVADLNVRIYIHPTNAWQIPQNYQDHPELRAAIWAGLRKLRQDRVLFSIDYPYESSKAAGDCLDNAGLPADTLGKVASGNAKRLLHLSLRIEQGRRNVA